MTNIISNFYQRYLSIALISSVSIHLTIIFTYYIFKYYDTDEPAVIVRLIQYEKIPQTGIIEEPPVPLPNISTTNIPAKLGIPVPVPETAVSPEQTILTQKELSSESNSINEFIKQGGTISTEKPDIKIEDADPPDFVKVEELPVPVKLVQPDYLDLAKRSGVEGTVWVKILVSKEGKAKKALVIKSDAEIFNDASVAAAMQWLFTPAMMNSGAIAVWVTVPFKFRLNK
jgi:protein TonB